ncbi:hypothetical protein E2C01_067939 [Portunus trituberculatus]|uniref:Uncharacterized protein n=1 Tax=Portunus trituberculatus TaxID=210409 RepID=A0A5B7HYS8_PORTR|nr:hypothetical protein [Portunus trituberculatus]
MMPQSPSPQPQTNLISPHLPRGIVTAAALRGVAPSLTLTLALRRPGEHAGTQVARLASLFVLSEMRWWIAVPRSLDASAERSGYNNKTPLASMVVVVVVVVVVGVISRP